MDGWMEKGKVKEGRVINKKEMDGLDLSVADWFADLIVDRIVQRYFIPLSVTVPSLMYGHDEDWIQSGRFDCSSTLFTTWSFMTCLLHFLSFGLSSPVRCNLVPHFFLVVRDALWELIRDDSSVDPSWSEKRERCVFSPFIPLNYLLLQNHAFVLTPFLWFIIDSFLIRTARALCVLCFHSVSLCSLLPFSMWSALL